jgi:hypothetical protein
MVELEVVRVINGTIAGRRSRCSPLPCFVRDMVKKTAVFSETHNDLQAWFTQAATSIIFSA